MHLLPPQQRFHIRPILKPINSSTIPAYVPRMALPALTRRPDFRIILLQGLCSTIREPSHNANITGRLQQRLKIRITVGYEEHVLLPLWWYMAQNLIHKFRLVPPENSGTSWSSSVRGRMPSGRISGQNIEMPGTTSGQSDASSSTRRIHEGDQFRLTTLMRLPWRCAVRAKSHHPFLKV